MEPENISWWTTIRKVNDLTKSILILLKNDQNMQPNKKCYHFNIYFIYTQENIVRQACKTLGQKMTGNCSVTVEIHGKRLIATVTIDGEGNVMDSKHIKALL